MMAKRLHENAQVYAAARTEMLKYCEGRLPPVFDPFAGGGSIPLEASRLGFEAHAADLNPVAVLLNKCNLELAPRWDSRPPANPEDRRRFGGTEAWRGTNGLAADVRYYGRVVLDRAREKIGHLYPRVRLPKNYGRGEGDALAWIWARTVASPDPALRGVHVPLVSTYRLSTKKDGQVWLEPVVDRAAGTFTFEIRTGVPKDPTQVRAGTKYGRGFRCLLSDTPIPFDYIRREGQAGRIGVVMLAIVAKVPRGRGFVAATTDQVKAALAGVPVGVPESDLPEEALGFRVQNYGIRKHWQMFTPRQLTAMVTLSDLVLAIGQDVERDAVVAGLSDVDVRTYAQTVRIFLALALSRSADHNNALCTWDQSPAGQRVKHLFGRQTVSMVWDFAEANILGDRSVCWKSAVDITAEAIESLSCLHGSDRGSVRQIDAASGANSLGGILVSTDPPYYDNIGYGALSDFFYVWLRRTVGDIDPDLFSTLLAPKRPELTAAPERFEGDKQRAKEHFEAGFRRAFTSLRAKIDRRFPLTVYYAFKQDDEDSATDEQSDRAIDLTTGWETLLEALIGTGFQITATWPVRASQEWRMRAMGSNALASYIVLACRSRAESAPLATRKEFLASLKRELPKALKHLQHGSIAPVDLAQAAIGPGMAVFSCYAKVVEADGTRMPVRTALGLINQVLDEVLAEQESEFDADTRWALAWFEQHGMGEGPYGDAEMLSKAKDTAVSGLQEAGILEAKKGKVRLLRRDEMSGDWDPATDRRLTVWELTQHLIRRLEAGGESSAAELLKQVGSLGDVARDLAYRLYNLCERKGWAQEATAYNGLVTAWPELTRLAQQVQPPGQGRIFS
jgi:putative DNA methylase